VVIVLAVCLLLLFKTKQHQRSALPEQGEAPTNQASQPEQPKVVEHRQITNTTPILSLPEFASPLAKAVAVTNSIAAHILAAWQAPIEFYGRVVDENTNPVPGVNIHFNWSELPERGGERTSDTQSDSDGLFSLHGKRGAALTVSFGKLGYYSSGRGEQTFSYAFPQAISPDPQNPVTFVLHKKGQGIELITSQNGIRPNLAIRVPKDNIPVRVDFFQKQASATGQFEISQNKPPFQGATNWSFSLSIPDGGLVENQDEFQFQAPETGYQSIITFDFTKGETNWTTQVTKQFYITFGEPKKYGWLRIESNLTQETVFLTYAINPTGSYNLEPMEIKSHDGSAPPPGVRAVIPEFK
jgi:hypothetical protein